MVDKTQFRKGSYAGLNDFVDMIRYMQVSEDLDSLVGISGFKGFGKSTFSKQVLIRYAEKYMGVKNFTPAMLENYTTYTVQDLDNALNNLPVYAPIDVDEAVNFAMGEDWMLGKNKKTKKKFAKIRNKHHVFLFNIPDLWWLDKKYRENMMTVWVHIVKKGHVMVAFPNTAPGIEDRWDRKWLQKQFTKNPSNYFTPLDNMMKKLRRYPCYFDEFAFPKLEERIYNKHLELRNVKVMDDGSDEQVSMRGLTQKQKAELISPIFKIQDSSFKKEYTKIISDGGWTNKKLWHTFYKGIMSFDTFVKYKQVAGLTEPIDNKVLLPNVGNKKY